MLLISFKSSTCILLSLISARQESQTTGVSILGLQIVQTIICLKPVGDMGGNVVYLICGDLEACGGCEAGSMG